MKRKRFSTEQIVAVMKQHEWDQEGPHIMMLFPTLEEIAELPRDPNAGGPYVMWDETPLVHVMFPMTDRDR